MNDDTLPVPLIGPEALRDWITRGVVLLDCSFDLMDTSLGERQYREAHLPGAYYVHLERDLSGPKSGPDGRFRGRHPLPSREAFAATAGALGIAPATPVVVYDRKGAMYAVRAWWMLRWLGHGAVAVLDGGLSAWQAAGGTVDADLPTPRPQPPYPLGTPLVAAVDIDLVKQSLGRVVVLDGRAPERFRGEVEPIDTQAGHIPGALNRFYGDNLGPDGRFKSRDRLRAEFAPLLGSAPEQAIHYCGSGVTACHNLLAAEVAGWRGGLLYPGSWSEWSSDPSRPVARSV
jgi:thiosulfate/3-mercaptopyruvate sulfurtransferase